MNGPERRYLIFSIKDALYAFDLAQVAEVSEPPATWPIPAAPPYYPGAMNFHGVIVAVMDLPAFMGIKDCHPTEKLIVLDTRLAALGFLVEKVVRIVREDEVSTFTHQDDGFSSGFFDFSGRKVTLLDPSRIVTKATETINN
jgi:chemotaxis signal transduction protein